MSQASFWGLTGPDIYNSFCNVLCLQAASLTGSATAIMTNLIVVRLLSDRSSDGSRQRPHLTPKSAFCTLLATGAGFAAGFYVAARLPFVTFAANKALKLFVISIVGLPIPLIPFMTTGGAVGYFGRKALYFAASVGALSPILRTAQQMIRP